MKSTTKLWIGIVILIILTPLGLLLPSVFKAEGAWGEWGPEEVQKLAGYVPEKLEKLTPLWKAPLPDYVFGGWENKGMGHLSVAYICSAVLGIIIVVAISYAVGKLLAKKEKT